MKGVWKFISFSRGAAIGIFIVAGVLMLFEWGAASLASDVIVVAKDQKCSVSAVDGSLFGNRVSIDCGGVSYAGDHVTIPEIDFKDPKPLNCTIYKSGKFDCKFA